MYIVIVINIIVSLPLAIMYYFIRPSGATHFFILELFFDHFSAFCNLFFTTGIQASAETPHAFS
jgi:hypothetical protein